MRKMQCAAAERERYMNAALLKEALADMKAAVRTTWENSSGQTDEYREQLWMILDGINKFEGYLEATLAVGASAAEILDGLVEKKKELKLMGMFNI